MPRVGFLDWIWKAFARTALIPLLLVELGFLVVYFAAHAWVDEQNRGALGAVIEDALTMVTEREARNIQEQLARVRSSAEVYARQVRGALDGEPDFAEVDAARLVMDGEMFISRADRPEGGGAAFFFSGHVPVGDEERKKAARLSHLQPLMRDLHDTDPLLAAIYFNTFDSFNIIYPYFDVKSQYPNKMDIPSYNFYYEADAKNNPERTPQWTNVYIDPAGNGWMTSCIIPVYRGDFLEGVVGLDVTVDRIIKHILALQIPWDGYAMLVDKNGVIMALPPAGEKDWGLSELTTHDYQKLILSDTFKPDSFNVKLNPNASVQRIANEPRGVTRLNLGGRDQALAWATVPSTGWKLVVLVPEASAFAIVDELGLVIQRIGWWMVASLVVFYVFFFLFLFRRARTMSAVMAAPLVELNDMVKRIGAGAFAQPLPELAIVELQETAEHLRRMGLSLAHADAALRRQIAERSAQLIAVLNIKARPVDALAAGTEVNGRYRVTRTIGAGAMGSVYEVTRLEDGSRWAMKVASGVAGVAYARLAREANVLSRVQHENVVGIVDVGVADRGFVFIVIELVLGESLREWSRARGPLSYGQVVELLVQVARGVAALHRASIAHRDLKPENVLVTERDGVLTAKITDFGISRLAIANAIHNDSPRDGDERSELIATEEQARRSDRTTETATAEFKVSRPSGERAAGAPPTHKSASSNTGRMGPALFALTEHGAISGTPHYIAPELAFGASPEDPRTDLYSFGVLAYELVMGKCPYAFILTDGVTQEELASLAPPPGLVGEWAPLDGIIRRCLAFDATERPTAERLVEELEHLYTTSTGSG